MALGHARVRIGDLWIDRLRFDEALDAIEALVDAGRGGIVFTPNVDHVVLAERDPRLRDAYEKADLSLVDGQPVVWASRLLGTPLPEKISGSDLGPALLQRAARRGDRVFLLGGGPGVAERAAERIARDPGVTIAGVAAPRIGFEASDEEARAIEQVSAARPHLVLVGLGAPKQELFLQRNAAALRPAVGLGVGATLDFLAGTVRRSPPWMSRCGLEWLYRLRQDPRRLARRYLVQDPRFAVILLRTLRTPRGERVQAGPAPAP